MAFAHCEIDLDRYEFRRQGELLKLEPQVFDILAFLARNPGRLVTRDELVELVWGGRSISDSTIDARIAAARKAIGDDGRLQSVLTTVPRRGWRFNADVQASEDDGNDGAPKRAEHGANGRSVVVLPFSDISDARDQGYFCDGVVDDIITELCRYPDLMVVSRNASQALQMKSTDAREIGEEFGVRFALEGSVRRLDDRFRLSVRLVDCETGAQAWAERYERRSADLFDLQAEIARIVASTVGARLHEVENSRLVATDPKDLGAYELAQRAYAKFLTPDLESLAEARRLAEQAIKLDPGYSRAYSSLAWTYVQDRFNGFAADPDLWLKHAFEASAKAVALNSGDPFASVAFAMTLLHMRQHLRACAELDRAIALSPSYAELYAQKANVLGFMGQTEEAASYADRALRMHPRAPGHFHLMRGRAYLARERYEEALHPLETAVSLRPEMAQIHIALAVSYNMLGKKVEALREVADVTDRSPLLTISYLKLTLPYEDTDILEKQLGVLSELGLAP